MESFQLYDDWHVVYTTLKNQLVAVFEDAYLSPLNNLYTGYAGNTTLSLITYLYKN